MAIDGVEPTLETIADGSYRSRGRSSSTSRTRTAASSPASKEFVAEYVSENAHRPGRLPRRARPDPAARRRARARLPRRRPATPKSCHALTARQADPSRRPRHHCRRPFPHVSGRRLQAIMISYLLLTILILLAASPTPSAAAGRRTRAASPRRAGRTQAAFAARLSRRLRRDLGRHLPALLVLRLARCSRAGHRRAARLDACPPALTDGADGRAVALLLAEIHNVAAGQIFSEPDARRSSPPPSATPRWQGIAGIGAVRRRRRRDRSPASRRPRPPRPALPRPQPGRARRSRSS